MARLLVNPGTADEWEIPLKPGANRLGRSVSADFQIDHESISEIHCQIILNGNSVSVEDLGSANGTFLEGAPIERATLVDGQCLQLGSIEVKFVADAPRVAATPIAVRLATAPAQAGAAAASAEGSAPPRPVVRLAAHESPPPPPSVPGTYVPDEYSVEPDGPAMCKYHPRSNAYYLCPQCRLYYCELCVAGRPGGARTGKFCRRCSAECVALNVQVVRPGIDKTNFFETVPKAFAYPLTGNGLIFLMGGMVLLLFVSFVGSIGFIGLWSFFLWLFLLSYIFAYVQRVVQTAAQGSDEQAGWPDISEPWQDIVVPCFQIFGLGVICFGPAFGLAIWLGSSGQGGAGTGGEILVVAAAALGALYFPMAFLAVAMFDTVTAMNPLVVIGAMTKMPLEYLTVLLVTATIVAISFGEQWAVSYVKIPILPQLISGVVELYLLTVWARLLGLMYYAKRDALGWFSFR